MQEALDRMPQDYWTAEVQQRVSATISDRADNMATFKPGVSTIFLVFSTSSTNRVWQLPLYRYLQAELEPLLRSIIGDSGMSQIVRLQLARMSPGSQIHPHVDNGDWAAKCVLMIHERNVDLCLLIHRSDP